MPPQSSSRCGPRRGAIAVQVALSLTALLGVAALVLDAGLLMSERRHAQAAADAAALAAAIDLYGDVSPYTTTKQTATNVGTTNYADTSHLTVTPNIPPLNGTFSDTVKYPTGGYVEVIVEWDQPRAFSAIWGSDNIPVTGRAVARVVASTWGASILTLDASAQSLVLTGGSLIKVPGAVIVDSSDSSRAISLSGTGTSLVAPVVNIVSGAGIKQTGGATISPTPTVAPSTPDPLATLAVPPYPGVPSPAPPGYIDGSIWSAPNGTTTINPGRYAGISVKNGNKVIMNPGIYYLTGDGSSGTTVLLVQNNGSTLSGTGVLIYNGEQNGSTANPSTVGQIQIQSGGVMTLTPMPSGTWQGINIWQDRNATAPVTLTGGSGTNIAGMVYAAKSAVTATGGSSIIPGSAFIADTLTINGSGTMNLPLPSVPVPIPGAGQKVSLVE